MNNESTTCSKCKCSLENIRSISFYEGNTIVDVLCHECHSRNQLNDYIKSKKLSTDFVTNVTLDLLSLSYPRDIYNRHTVAYDKTFRYLLDGAPIEELEEFKYKVDAYLDYSKICKSIKEFESNVWFSGLKKIINKSKRKGVSAKNTPVKGFVVLTYSMCGRTMITIENEQASVTMMCAEDSETPSMGFRGIDATAEQAIFLIQLAIDLYKDGSLDFKDDDEVSYL